MRRDKSFADDLEVATGRVPSRVTLSLRASERQPARPWFVGGLYRHFLGGCAPLDVLCLQPCRGPPAFLPMVGFLMGMNLGNESMCGLTLFKSFATSHLVEASLVGLPVTHFVDFWWKFTKLYPFNLLVKTRRICWGF